MGYDRDDPFTAKGFARMHTHFSAMSALAIFLVVLIIGSAWRLAAYRLGCSDRAELRTLSAAMVFQY